MHCPSLRGRSLSAGFTSIETAIAGLVMTVVLGGAGYALQRSLATFEQSQASADLNGRAARAMQRISSELIGASWAGLLPKAQAPFSSDNVQYEWATGTAAGQAVWGSRRGIALDMGAGEIDNGLDDDGDGLVDERSVVLVTNAGAADEIRTVIANGVPELLEGEDATAGIDENGNGLEEEAGLAFEVDLANGRLIVRLSMQQASRRRGTITVTQQASIRLRNQ